MPISGQDPDISEKKPRAFQAFLVDRILRILDGMWAQIATTLTPYTLPALAMLGGYLVVYKLVEKTAAVVFKLEPKSRSRQGL